MQRAILSALLATLLCSALFVPVASANGGVTSTVSYIGTTANGKAWVRFAANITGTRPACTFGNWNNEFVFDTTTEMGKIWLNMLMAAYLSGKTVQVSGSNTCTGTSCCTQMSTQPVGWAENLEYVRMQ